MENETLRKNMIDRYNALSYTHNYIFGYISNGVVYASLADASILPYILKLGTASRGNGCDLRLRFNRKDIEFFRTYPTIDICSKDYFFDMVENSKYNKGEIFEKLVTEKLADDKEWKKDNVPFTKAGDIEINGIPYQIKFDRATFTNEKSLARLETEK